MTLLFPTLFFKSLLVFVLAGAALLALRRASAAARHLVCLLSLVSLLALPLFSLTLPGWRLPVLEPSGVPIQKVSSPEPSPPQAAAPPAPARKASAAGTTGRAKNLPPPVPTPPSLPVSGGQALVPGRFPSPWLLALYLIGILLAGLRPLLGLWGIARLHRLCTEADDTQTLTIAAHCATLLRLRLPRLCRADVSVPMTWGGRRPVVLLPIHSVDWPEDRLRSVLLHEMAHIKRHDWSCHRFADLVCALYWFHPLVWLTARRLRSESELACDDLVLSSGIAAPDYARHLLDVAQALRPASPPPHSAIAMAQTSRIEGRLTMILDKTRSRRTLTRRVSLTVLTLAAAALVTLAMLRPVAKVQAVSEGAEVQRIGDIAVQILGVTAADHSGSRWWKPDGQTLPSDIYNTAIYSDGLSGSSPQTKNVIFAIAHPSALEWDSVSFDPVGSSSAGSSNSLYGRINGQETLGASLRQRNGGLWTLSASFPSSMTAATIRVGVASGAWTTAASNSHPTGGSGSQDASSGSSFLFSPATETHNGGVVTITNSDIKQAIRFVAVDIQGHEHILSSISGIGSGSINQHTLSFNLPLSQIKEFRVETRPFVWTEFKNVALQPTK